MKHLILFFLLAAGLLPILHIHGTADDVCAFSGAQPALNVWIKHNGCPTTAQVTNNYNGFNAKMHTWAPGNDGVEVKLLELANKGHWVCKEPQVYTGKEMWNFCKKYSLNRTADVVYGDCILGQLILTADSYETTGVALIENGEFSQRECGVARLIGNDCVYDMQGRRVMNPQHGLYIKNGKKIIVR